MENLMMIFLLQLLVVVLIASTPAYASLPPQSSPLKNYQDKNVLIHWRGGAQSINKNIVSAPSKNKSKSKNKNKAKSLNKRNKKTKNYIENNSQLFADDPDNNPSSLPSNYVTYLSIESLLVKRLLSFRFVIRLICTIWFISSSLSCLATMGGPHTQAIWVLTQSAGTSGTMPINWIPSKIDAILADVMAQRSKEVIPPFSMPNPGPLFSWLSSIVLFLFLTVLLPKWWTPFQVFLDYKPYHATSAKKDKKHQKQLHVLVHPLSFLEQQKQMQLISSNQSHESSHEDLVDAGSKSLMIFPLHDSPTIGMENKFDFYFGDLSPHYFEWNYCRYYIDIDTLQCQFGGPKFHTASLMDLQEIAAASTNPNENSNRFAPYNTITLSIPTIYQTFMRRISSPLAVVQILGSFFSIIEEGGYATLLSAGNKMFEQYWNARQTIKSAKVLAQEVATSVQDTSNEIVYIRRIVSSKDDQNYLKWIKTTASELLPGDTFVLPEQKKNNSHQKDKSKKASASDTANKKEFIVPVDALLLDGQCLTNEAVLTGESVPQIKMPINFIEASSSSPDGTLDMQESHRQSILFAGTTIIHCTLPPTVKIKYADNNLKFSNNTAPPSGIRCIALRTGSYSSKGELIRNLQKSTDGCDGAHHVGSITNPDSERDAIRLIGSLSVLAFLSCVSLFIPRPSTQTQTQISVFRRIIQCTRIIIASIPSSLPTSLVAVARQCSYNLKNDADVVCSEPGALLTAAHVDMVVFDKTGTITADTQSLSKVDCKKVHTSDITMRTELQNLVLAGCNSLIQLKLDANDSTAIGDPLDMAALQGSGWKYDQKSACYKHAGSKQTKMENNVIENPSDPIKMWQLRTFPFDPNKRMSSAIVLTKYRDGTFHLWNLIKGSPETMLPLYTQSSQHDKDEFIQSYNSRNRNLEGQGYRTIALGGQDLTTDKELVKKLFPSGIGASRQKIEVAMQEASLLHRLDFEGGNMSINQLTSVELLGFACFDTTIRKSSSRVIRELIRSEIDVTMLTGDAIDAALSVALRVDLISTKMVAVLETIEDVGNQPILQWRILQISHRKGQQPKVLHNKTKYKQLSKALTKKLLNQSCDGICSLAASGQAIEVLFSSQDKETKKSATNLLQDNLNHFSIIARATPRLKKTVIASLKERCGKTVLMCGDGVNDVAAIKAADVAVALLNGFGAEAVDVDGDTVDMDEERRLQNVLKKRIGSHRSMKKFKDLSQQKRLKKSLEKAHYKIRKRAADRQGIKDPDSPQVEFNLSDIKDMLSSSVRVVRDEQKRSKQLRLGGGEAARILAQDENERKSNSDDVGHSNNVDNNEDNQLSTSLIKPGEASLVAAFSCLRPSIQGVDSILRAGIAAAACTLSAQISISVYSLMACYNMASLYRDGFRYGKHMSIIEMTVYIFMDMASFASSSKPRPKLPSSIDYRPPKTMFDTSLMLSTIGQSIVHIASTTMAVGYAAKLESTYSTNASKKQAQTLIRSVDSKPLVNGGVASRLANILLSTANNSFDDNHQIEKDMFGRPKFRPNYLTNVVFIFSMLQGAIAPLCNHIGKPFHPGILESRVLCEYACITLFFCVILLSEILPFVNRFLELKFYPNRHSKVIIMMYAIINILGCVACRQLLLRPSVAIKNVANETEEENRIGKALSAADKEAELLKQEAQQNRKYVIAMALVMIYICFLGVTSERKG